MEFGCSYALSTHHHISVPTVICSFVLSHVDMILLLMLSFCQPVFTGIESCIQQMPWINQPFTANNELLIKILQVFPFCSDPKLHLFATITLLIPLFIYTLCFLWMRYVPVRKALAKKSGYMKFHSVYSPFTSRLRYILTWKRLKFIIERRCVQIHVADYDEFKQCMRPSPLVGLHKLDRRRRKRKQAFLLTKISLRSFSKLVHDLKNLQLRCLHQTKAFHFAEYQSVRRLISRILSYLIHKKQNIAMKLKWVWMSDERLSPTFGFFVRPNSKM